VRPGEAVAFSVKGTWCMEGAGETAVCGGAGGVAAPGNDPVPLILGGANVGALLARAGTGPWFEVGTGGDFTMAGSGRLVLLFNDRPTSYADNSGDIKVRVTRTR
jgi:hypothetical protein